jgi:GntR family transcriptional repressor for pyruvate dehydrogenase complex
MHMAMPADGASLLASRVSRAEAIARELEREIAGGTHARGDRLGTKGDLRARFGVAVATVNEAVRLLELRGLITARPGPGGGVFVAAPSARTSRGQLALGFDWGPDSLDDAFDVLDALEPLVQVDAAGRRTKADVTAMTKLLAQMEAATDDRVAYLALRMSLRRRVAKVSHNAPLQSLYLTIVGYLEESVERLASGSFDVDADLVSARSLVAWVADGGGGRGLVVQAA